jgi:hypothetical protein
VIVVLLGVMLTHRRWVSHQPGAASQRSASSTARCRGRDPSGRAATAAGSATCWSGPRRWRCSEPAGGGRPSCRSSAQPRWVKGYREIRILLTVRSCHFCPRMLAGKEEAA